MFRSSPSLGPLGSVIPNDGSLQKSDAFPVFWENSLIIRLLWGLSFDHKIKARAHKGDMRIGMTPKKLASICCPQCRESKADTLKATEANRRRGPGTREKVRSKRINLEGNTHAQDINVSQLLV
jgi:hypothetical protein